MDSLISVIVPVYNVEKYLRKCVDSILSQTYKNLEIILIDDGSTDSSGKLCDELEKTDPRISVLHKDNGGLSSARNAGLDRMHGEYVLFVDSDDYISGDCVEHLYAIMTGHKAQLSVGNFKATYDDACRFCDNGAQDRCITGRDAIALQFGKNTVQMTVAWAKLYEASLFRTLRFPIGLLHEDEGTTYKALYLSDRVVVSDKVVYAYRCNPESITKQPKKKNYEDLCAILKEQIRFYQKNNEHVLENRVRNRFAIQTMSHLMPKNYYGDQKELMSEAKEIYKNRGILKMREIPFSERMKGAASAYCGIWTAGVMDFARRITSGKGGQG